MSTLLKFRSVWLLPVALFLSLLSCAEPKFYPEEYRNLKAPVERRVSDLIRRMRPDEKVALIRGARGLSMRANDRLGIPALSSVAGAMGISARDASGRPIPATAFPANIGMAATWNPSLLEQAGTVIAQQALALGRGQVLGPLVEVNGSALNGRVFETYGQDPWLVSRIADGYISGVQGEGAIATAIYSGGSPETRASREFELRPLEAAVTEAGVWAAMPRPTPPAGVLPGAFLHAQLGLRGFDVIPGGTDDGLAAAGGDAIDAQVQGILRAMIVSGIFDRNTKPASAIETTAHRAVARAAAAQSIVLLKNEASLLPLEAAKLRSIAVIGPNASVNRMAAGSYTVPARYGETPLDALRTAFGSKVATDGGSKEEAAKVARGSDLAIVFVGTGSATETETADRASLDLPAGQDELIESVAKANPRTIVVVIGGSPVAMGKWIHHVPAVLEAWFPGEEGGNAIADVLTGAVNPSGRLPIAFPARSEDLASAGKVPPLFPFGFGLSYTQFAYSDLAVTPATVAPTQLLEVSLNVRNAGSRAGKETVQVYLHATRSDASLERADQSLCAFQQVELKPGETKRVRFTLTSSATAYFDEQRQDWLQDQAGFEVRVGPSSGDIRATGKFVVAE